MLKRILFASAISATLLMSCGEAEQTIHEPTKGVATFLREKADSTFEIVDEQILPNKEDSYVIISRLDGRRDSIPMREIKSFADNQESHRSQPYYRRRSSLTSVLLTSMAASYITNRMFGGNRSRRYYANDKVYQKSNKMHNSMKNTATQRKVKSSTLRSYGSRRTASGSSSSSRTRSYGSSRSRSRSFRSYGG